MARVLFHIDLNAFFASAEEIKNPDLKGKPMAVGSLSSRGVLSTANYEARKMGVHSAMPLFQAMKLCPELIVVSGDYDYYRKLSNDFFTYLRRFSPLLEPMSIDECFLDVTDLIQKYKRPLDLAVQIQQGVLENLGLSCSIGVASTRFLAKMASDMRKPMGITVLRKSELSSKLWPLDIAKMNGIGTKTVPLLREKGIETIGDFVNPENEAIVLQIMKKNGFALIQKARGNSSSQLNCSMSRKSVSISRTLPNDIYTLDEGLSQCRELCMHLSQKLKSENQKGKLISLVFRDLDFHNVMHSLTLEQYTNDFSIISGAIQSLVEDYFEPIGYRHIGVSMGSLKDSEKIVVQPTMFEPAIQTAQDVVVQLNKKLDANVFMRASDLLKGKKNE